MSRYAKGMKDGAKPFKDYFNDESEKLHQETSNISDSVDALRKDLFDTIDLINMDETQRSEFIEEIKSRNIKNKKPAKFKINVVYSKKEDEALADNLRVNLHNQENSTQMQLYNDYKKNAHLNDYTIFIGDSDELINDSSKELYSEYGMRIVVNKNNDIIVCYTGKIEDNDREQFITYYTELMKRVKKENEKLQNAINKRKKEKIYSDDEMSYQTDKIRNFASEIQDNAIDTADEIIYKTNFWGLIPAVFLVLAGTAATIGVGLLSIPVAISEIAVKSTINGLINSNFDKEFVEAAQKQILLIQLCEYISIEQLRLAK